MSEEKQPTCYGNRVALITILLSLICLPVKELYAEGGKDGGGGTVISFCRNAKPFLLDLLMIQPELADENNCEAQPSAPVAAGPEVGPLLEADRAAFDLASEKLDAWIVRLSGAQQTSSELVQMLKQNLTRVTYSRTSHRFKVPPRYYLPESIRGKNGNIETAILFLDLYGAFISAPVWDSLDVETQAGLLIHEAFRQFQFQYGFKDITDKQIQMVTATIMLNEPSAQISFEKWMSTMLHRLCFVRALAKTPVDPNDPQAVLVRAMTKIVLDRELVFQESLAAAQSARMLTVTQAGRVQALRELLQKRILE